MKVKRFFEENTSWRTLDFGDAIILITNTEDSLKKYKFKIGDFVRDIHDSGIYEITAIDPEDDNDTYRLCNVLDDECGGWAYERDLTLVSGEEAKELILKRDAKQYNL